MREYMLEPPCDEPEGVECAFCGDYFDKEKRLEIRNKAIDKRHHFCCIDHYISWREGDDTDYDGEDDDVIILI